MRDAAQAHAIVGRMASGVKDLKVWQEAVTLGGDVVRAVRDSTRRETKAFTDWLMLTACTAAASIAAAHARRSASDERECYLRSRRALLELETGLTIARQAGIITSAMHSQLVSRVVALHIGHH